jgi:hypothetical protein
VPKIPDELANLDELELRRNALIGVEALRGFVAKQVASNIGAVSCPTWKGVGPLRI